MSIKLSFCIPTLNRAAFIGETLESIISQATDEVEIVIVDGASTDNTEEIIRSYQRRFLRLRYFRREKNMGVERDTQKAVELAVGEYCWLMTSDDVLKPSAIGTVINAIRQGHALIVVNAEVRNPDLSEVIEETKLRIETNRVYGPGDYEKIFVDTAEYLSYMGGVVIKKALWESRDKTDYLDTDFIHLGVIFQSSIPTSTLVLAAPLISIRYGNATWTPREFEVWAINWPKVIWSFRSISDSAKRQIFGHEGWRNIRRMIIQRASGTFSIKEYNSWIRPVNGYRYSKLLAKVISVLPRGLLNFLAVAYFSMRPHRGAILVELKQSRFYWLNHVSTLPSPAHLGPPKKHIADQGDQKHHLDRKRTSW